MNYRLLSNKHSNAHILSKRQLLCSVGTICLVLCISSWISLFLPFPELDAFMQRDWSTRIYDRGGNLIQILALEDGIRREFTAYEAIPPDAVRIFLAAEDKDFFSHRGIDIAAIARAAYQNISSGKRVSGASTITMQLARLIVPAKSARSLQNSARRGMHSELNGGCLNRPFLSSISTVSRSDSKPKALRRQLGIFLLCRFRN